MSLFVRSVSLISIFVSVSFICSYGFYFQFILFLNSTKVYNRVVNNQQSLVKRCNLISFYIIFCAKSVMITNGATDIALPPSRINGREQLPISAADASGAVRLLTSCFVARPLDGGQPYKKQHFVKTGYLPLCY